LGSNGNVVNKPADVNGFFILMIINQSKQRNVNGIIKLLYINGITTLAQNPVEP
jgi:hypothetical protein